MLLGFTEFLVAIAELNFNGKFRSSLSVIESVGLGF